MDYDKIFIKCGGFIWCKACFVHKRGSSEFASNTGKKEPGMKHFTHMLNRHLESSAHVQALERQRQGTLMDKMQVKAVEKGASAIDPHINTAYFIGESIVSSFVNFQHEIISWPLHFIAAKNDLPMLKAGPLHDLLEINGVEYGTRMYREDTACKEFIEHIDSALQERIKDELAQAEFISLLLDETTDNSTNKVILIFVYYVRNGIVKDAMLALRDLQGQGTAAAILKTVQCVMKDCNVGPAKVVCLGTDGASSMIADNGFCGLFQKEVHSNVLRFHCAAHRLQLAVQDALAGKLESAIDYEAPAPADDFHGFIEHFECTLMLIYKHFNKSSKRITAFQELMDKLKQKYRRFKKLYNVRWLSRREAILALLINHKGLLEYTEILYSAHPSDPTVEMLHKCVRDVRFLIGLHLMSKIHASLAYTSRNLQHDLIAVVDYIDNIQGLGKQLKAEYIILLDSKQAQRLHAIKAFKEKLGGYIAGAGTTPTNDGHEIVFPTSGIFNARQCQADNDFYNAVGEHIIRPMSQELVNSLEKRFPMGDVMKAFHALDLRTMKKEQTPEVFDLLVNDVEKLNNHFTKVRTTTVNY